MDVRGDEMVMCGDGISRPASQLRNATHREAYPEQYSHPAVGKRMRAKNGKEGVVDRVTGGSRFGVMAHFEGWGNVYFRLSDLAEVSSTAGPHR